MTPIQPGGPRAPDEQPHHEQHVTAVGGFAYGVIGASLHIFGDGVPLYLLENWHPTPDADPEFLRELPSRMLSARFAVVDFTGRRAELADLHGWCRDGPRLAARWLHGPGGQGKSRLAARFAAEALGMGWKVVTATHGPGSVLPPPGSQDLRQNGAAGLLLIVDYADRWPRTHLTWLLSNALLHQPDVRARVLLLARTADAWPALRASLTNQQAGTSSQYLEPLDPEAGGSRDRMFTVARRTFAALYRLGDPSAVAAPSQLSHPDFGLTLAVHMAALVAVDAHVTGRRPAEGAANLALYLLDREHAHWARLFGDTTHELEPAQRTYRTAPEVMRRAVFTAALTGPLARSTATTVLSSLGVGPAEQVCGDHTVCYPPISSAAAVLEPLYPDRLAEDFIALTLPGHHADYPATEWASYAVRTLLGRDDAGAAPAWTARGLAFLLAAAERWPHVTLAHLYPLLREDPRLAVDAGSPALTGLARQAHLDTPLGQSIAGHFPRLRHVDLDVGMAALTSRLGEQMIDETPLEDEAKRPLVRALIRSDIAVRHSHAGQYDLAVAAMERSVADWEAAATTISICYEPKLAHTLTGLSTYLYRQGRTADALAASERAVALLRKWTGTEPTVYGLELAAALGNLGLWLAETGRRAEAGPLLAEAVALLRPLARADPDEHDPKLASALHNLGSWLAGEGSRAEALETSLETLSIRRRLAGARPETYEPDLADILTNVARDFAGLGRRAEALAASTEAAEVCARLARRNPAAHEGALVAALSNLSTDLAEAGRLEEALAENERETAVLRRLVEANPAAHEPALAQAVDNRGQWLAELGRPAEALAANEEALAMRRRLWQANPAAHEATLARTLGNLGVNLLRAGRHAEALESASRAVTMLRQLALANPAAHEPELARCLANLGFILTLCDRLPEALPVTEEAASLWERLAAAQPAAHETALARSLFFLATCRHAAGRPADALGPMARSVAILRRPPGMDPVAQTPQLARSLDMLARLYLALGRTDDALTAAEEAQALRSHLAEANPTAHGAGLEVSNRLVAAVREATSARHPRLRRWPWRRQ